MLVHCGVFAKGKNSFLSEDGEVFNRPGAANGPNAVAAPALPQDALRIVGQQKPQVAEVVASWAGDDGIAQSGEHGAGVEGGQR
jgi:hypothetical protein